MPTLNIVAGTHAGKRFDLANRPLSIGRDPSRDIQIVDPKVSRKHALVRRAGEGYLIAPAKALNGILINGAMIESEAPLNDGDEIVLGDTVLRFEADTDTDHTNAVFGRKLAGRELRENKTIT